MKGVILTWLIAEGIISYRQVRQTGGPPAPGLLLGTSGLFVLLALLAEVPNGATLATLIGAGLDIRAFMTLFPSTPAAATAAAPAKTAA